MINRATKAITRWPVTGHNTPMTLDEADHRLFVGTSQPPRLVVFDTSSGHLVASIPSVGADDLYYDSSLKRIYMPGAEGFLNVFEMKDPDHFRLLAHVPTALGAATAGYPGVIGKGLTVSTWRFHRLAPAKVPKSGCTILFLSSLEAQLGSGLRRTGVGGNRGTAPGRTQRACGRSQCHPVLVTTR